MTWHAYIWKICLYIFLFKLRFKSAQLKTSKNLCQILKHWKNFIDMVSNNCHFIYKLTSNYFFTIWFIVWKIGVFKVTHRRLMLNYSRNALFVIFGGESHLNESIEFINHCKFRKWVLVFASVAFYTIRIGDKVFKRYQMQCQILLLISWFISIFFTLMINTRHSYTIWFLDSSLACVSKGLLA